MVHSSLWFRNICITFWAKVPECIFDCPAECPNKKVGKNRTILIWLRHLSEGCWWWLSVQQGGWPPRKYPCFISGTCTLLGDVITFYFKLPDMCRNQLHFSKPICLLMLCNTNFRFYNWGYCFTNFYRNSACCGTLRVPPCNVRNIIMHSIILLFTYIKGDSVSAHLDRDWYKSLFWLLTCFS